MRVDPKRLVKRLTPTATRALEAAVGRAAGGQYYEVSPEHLLLALLQPDQGDAAQLCAQAGLDRRRLIAQVEQALQSMKTGNPGRPVFAPSLFRWISDAWLLASVDHGSPLLRSGMLLVTWARKDGAYSAANLPELEALAGPELGSKLQDLLAASPEDTETALTPAPGTSAASSPARPGREALNRYTVSFTEQARSGKIDPVLGRHREIREVISILSRRRKNNPIIVGEPGVGKTALVEGLALAVVQGDVPQELAAVEVLGLDLGALQAGAGVRGEFENRLKAVIGEVKASPTPIVLFIDEAHTLIGAGGAQGTGDAANLLKPELARGELRTIAATTWAEYKRYFEKDAALERRFQPVKVEEPSEAEAISILRGLKQVYEKAHGIEILDEAVVAAAQLSSRYVSGRQLPDKAVDLLDSAATKVKLGLQTKPDALVALEARIHDLTRTAAAIQQERHAGHAVDAELLEAVEQELAESTGARDALQQRWQAERAAVEALRGAASAKRGEGDEGVRVAASDELSSAQQRLATLRHAHEPLIFERVDAHAVAQVVERWTGIPVGKLRGDSINTVLALEDRLRERVRGQDEAVRTVAETVRNAKAGVQPPETPQGVLLFVGPSGVGKTETALALADLLYGGERFLTTINMSEFQEKHSLSRLIGSPPGYVGYGEGGVLTEAVRQRPYSVVLLDEVEKADLEVMNLFYQVFDKGSLSDGEGRVIDFKNTIVILTSNLATDQIMALYGDGRAPSAEEAAHAIRPVLSRHFKPALLARMTIVPYRPMDPVILQDIAAMKLQKLCDRVAQAHKLKVHAQPEVAQELARRCREAEAGARNVDHVLRGSLMPALSRELLKAMAAEQPMSRLDIGFREGTWQLRIV